MNEIRHESFGVFLRELRNEKGLTQKQLAEQLFVSDKAVSKWERGLSMPEVSLLLPLAEILGVSVTELLRAERTEKEMAFSAEQVEVLVAETIQLSREERREEDKRRIRRRLLMLAVCLTIAALEAGILLMQGYEQEAMFFDIGMVLVFALGVGVWFGFFSRKTLPAYYDTNRITAYYEGAVRMNIPGLYLNNSNWPHVVRACWMWSMVIVVAFPLLVLLLTAFAPELWERGKRAIMLCSLFTAFPTIFFVGKRYE